MRCEGPEGVLARGVGEVTKVSLRRGLWLSTGHEPGPRPELGSRLQEAAQRKPSRQRSSLQGAADTGGSEWEQCSHRQGLLLGWGTREGQCERGG